jgi:ubiquinone/menaquinone biosynthesis C-methylase UbiE
VRIKHFVNDYRKFVSGLLAGDKDQREVMSTAVGGDYEATGQVISDLLRMHGLRDGMRLIDMGCGSGRVAHGVSKNFDISYHGTDIVQDLLDFAATVTPPHYRFSRVEELVIPDDDESADMVGAFSLFTHLLHPETYIYLEEVRRTLKPGGVLVFSFLEYRVPAHWVVMDITIQEAKSGSQGLLNVFMDRDGIMRMAEYLHMEVIGFMDDMEGKRIPLSRPVTYDSGETVESFASLGQSVCIMRKP